MNQNFLKDPILKKDDKESSLKEFSLDSPDQDFLLSKQLQKEFENILDLFQNHLLKKDLSVSEEKTREKIIHKIIEEASSPENKKRIQSEFSCFGPLDSLLCQEDINEIIINGKDYIFYEKQGRVHQLKDFFLSKLTFYNIIEKIGAESQITVNSKKPFNEGKWGSFRVHILRSPIIKGDFHLCLRRHPKNLWTLQKLENQNWATPSAIEIIRQWIRDKFNFLIIGPTSSGKTSVLNACLQEVQAHERIISIEDTDEIILPNKISTKLLNQRDPESPKALIDQQSLVKQSLRLRPDRLVMGEVRGEEAKDLLLALTTGHKGSIGTLHGKNHKQALWKLETLAQLGAPQWQSSTIKNLIFSSLKGLLILDKEEGVRRLKGIYKITALESSGFLFDSLLD